MEKTKCCVNGCEGKYEGWIDIIDNTNPKQKREDMRYGRFPFCKKHFDKIMPFLKKKEKEECKIEIDKDGHKWKTFWAYAPLKIVNEALVQ